MALGENIKDICKDLGIHVGSIWVWKRQRKEFLDLYTRARIDQMDAWAADLLHIADDESRDYYVDNKGERHSDNTSVNRDRLRADTRKWLMARIAATQYGDKVTTEHTGANGGPIQYNQLVDRASVETPEQWQERVTKEMQARAKANGVVPPTETKAQVH